MNYSITLYQTNSQHERQLYSKYIERDNATFNLENGVLWLQGMSRLFVQSLGLKTKLAASFPADFQNVAYTLRGYDLSALNSLTCVYNIGMDFPFEDPVMSIR